MGIVPEASRCAPSERPRRPGTPAAVGFVVIAILAFACGRSPDPQAAASPTSGVAEPAVFPGVEGRFRAADPGAWGTLERFTIDIRPPAEFIQPEDCPLQVQPWTLPGFDAASTARLFDKAGLSGGLRARFDQGTTCGPNGCTVVLDLDLLSALDQTARDSLFPTLGRYPGNGNYFYSFRRHEDRIDPWLAATDLSARGRSLVRGLLYRQGNNLHFASQPVACSQLDDADRVALMRALGMTRSVLVKVRIDRDTDVQRIADYWNQGRRNKDIGALLASMRDAEAESLDILHLLPPFARKRLFTFPVAGSLPWDCHWTALNFFNNDPDDRLLDTEKIIADFNASYRPVSTEALQFGDVLTFIADGNAFHSVVYIADDLVFTKNGRSFWRPWVLMTLEESIRYYKTQSPLQIRAFRRIDLE